MFETNPFNPPAADAATVPADPVQFLVIAAILAVIVLAAVTRAAQQPRRRPGRVIPFPSETRQPAPARPDRIALRDPAQQMHAIADVGFATVPLLNRSEARLFPALERAVRARGDGHRIMAQTSLGEILRPQQDGAPADVIDAAYFSINAKRLDFAVFNRFGLLVAAVEYQGHAHYNSKSFMRDAVKREALRKAGVPFLELPAGISPDEAAARLSDILARGAVAV